MFHLANAGAMYTLLLRGGANVMIPAFTPEGVLAIIEKERVTDTVLVPTMIQMLADHPKFGVLRSVFARSASPTALRRSAKPCCAGPWRPCRMCSSRKATA